MAEKVKTLVAVAVSALFDCLKSKDIEHAEQPTNDFLKWLEDQGYVKTENTETGNQYFNPILVSDDLPQTKEGIIADKLLLALSKLTSRVTRERNGRTIKAATSAFGKYRHKLIINGGQIMTINEKNGTFSFIMTEQQDDMSNDILSEFDDIATDIDDLDPV